MDGSDAVLRSGPSGHGASARACSAAAPAAPLEVEAPLRDEVGALPVGHSYPMRQPNRQATPGSQRPADSYDRPLDQRWPRTQSFAGHLGHAGSGRSQASTSVGVSAPPTESSLPDRTADQQYIPPSQPSSSAPPPDVAGAAGARGQHASHRHAFIPAINPSLSAPPRHDTFLARVLATTNWYELRAVLVSGASLGARIDGTFAADPGGLLAVVRHLASITRYDMRPHESAALGSFLEQWLLQQSGALRLMSPCELSLCLHALAKMANKALAAPPQAWTVAWFNAAQPYLLECAFRPKDISLTLWAVSRLQLRLPVAAMQLMLAAAEPHLDRFNGQDLSLVALALSAMQPRRNGGVEVGSTAAAVGADQSLLPGYAWQQRFLRRVARVLPECGTQALSNLLHGAVRSGMAVPEPLLGDICAALYAKLPECTPQALANVLSALAARGYLPEEGWVERFLVESGTRMEDRRTGAGGLRFVGSHIQSDSAWRDVGKEEGEGVGGEGRFAGGGGGHFQGRCNVEDLAHMATAAAQLDLRPPRWWVTRLYGAMERQLPQASSPRQLAQLLHGVALLHRSLVSAVAEGNVEAHGLGSGGTDGAAADAPAPPPPPPPRTLLVAWYHAAAGALPGFNTLDAAMSMWALAALDERPPAAWLQRLLVHCRPALPAAAPADLSVLLWSLAALGFRPTWSWLADAMEASRPGLGRMGDKDFAMLATALVRLGGRPTAAWRDALLAALRPQLPRMSTRALAQTAWALYRLRIQPPADWIEAAAGEQLRRWRATAWGGNGAAGGGRVVGSGDGVDGVLGAGAGPGAGGGSRRQQVRDLVLLLWVMSKWLGEQRVVYRKGAPWGSETGAALATGSAPEPMMRRPVGPEQAAVTPAAQPPDDDTLQSSWLPATEERVGGGRSEGSEHDAGGWATLCQRPDLPPLRQRPTSVIAAPAPDAASLPAPRPSFASFPGLSARRSVDEGSGTGSIAAGAVGAGPAPGLRLRRVTPRMLRRLRAARPGHIVASFNGDLVAAIAFRRRIGDQLVNAALDATLPLLAEAQALPGPGDAGGRRGARDGEPAPVWAGQDAVLFFSALRTLRASACDATRQRPCWVPAALAVTAPLLGSLTADSLQVLLSSLSAVGAEVSAEWAAACAASAAPHLGAIIPADRRIAVLRALYELRVSPGLGTGRDRGADFPAATRRLVGDAHGGADRMPTSAPAPALEPLLAAVLRDLQRASEAADALVELHVELLYAKVRLRRLAARLKGSASRALTPATSYDDEEDGEEMAYTGPGGRRFGGDGVSAGGSGRGAALRAAAAREIAAAAATASQAWQRGGRAAAAYDAASLARGVERVRESVALATEAVNTAVATVPDAAGRCRRPSGGVPRIPGTQRLWIWNRARRTAAAFQAQLSPVLVLHLIEMTATQLSARGDLAAAMPPASSVGPSAIPGDGDGGGVAGGAAQAPGLVHGESLLWLAGGTAHWWPTMLPTHRSRIGQHWRRVLERLARQGPAGGALADQLRARLPPGAMAVIRCRQIVKSRR